MCQGIIMTGVSFIDANGIRRHRILKGVGSHSSLLQKYRDKLRKAGWNDLSKQLSDKEVVISFESRLMEGSFDFTVEHSNSTYATRKAGEKLKSLMEKEWDKVAGSWPKIYRFIKRIKEVDSSMIENILTKSAEKNYYRLVRKMKDYSEDKSGPAYWRALKKNKEDRAMLFLTIARYRENRKRAFC
jgi:hypothetical protein